MKHALTTRLLLLLFIFCSYVGLSQQSSNTITYRITYDVSTQKYTVWVVPDYNVPNALNAGSTEKGATAQVTIAVPKDFVITNITDIRGAWEKAPLKLGPGQPNQDWSAYNLPATTNYYVIGKSAEETDYGSFVSGTPVALFTFQGSSCLGAVRLIEPTEAFITAADAAYSLNVANSYYSRSGQPAGGNQNPLEQFRAVSGSAANCSPTVTVVANPDVSTTQKGTATTTSVLSNDTNGGNPATTTNSTVTVSQTPSNGTAVVNPNGTITYTPNPNFVGTDCYVYRLCDKTTTTACDTAKVCVTVVDNTKIIYAFDDNNVTNQNTAVSGNVLTNDLLNNGTGPLVVTTTPVVQPTNGTVMLNANGTYTYTPAAGFTGTDTFKYQVCDSSTPKVCDMAVVSIEVKAGQTAANTPPIAIGDKAVLKTGTTFTGNVLINDVDPDPGQTLTATVVSNATNGQVLLNPNGTYTYTPRAGFVGTDSFTYKICDNGTPQLCDVAIVDIVVYGNDVNNAPPVANDDMYVRHTGQNVTGNVLTNDYSPFGSPLTVTTTPVTAPTKGNLSLNANGTFTYVPGAGFDGFDSFVYEVCDNNTPKQCSRATAFIIGENASYATDLSIKKTANKSGSVSLNEVITYRVVVKNIGQAPATNIVVKDQLPTGLEFVNAQVSKGTWSNPNWTIAALSVGDSAVLTLQAKVIAEGVTTNMATIESLDQKDLNTANNQASACVSVPILLCQGQSIQLSTPSTYTDVKWYRNGLMVGSGNSILIQQGGIYTTTASNSTCPAQGCCPIEVVSQVCCPTNLCIPVSFQKIKN